MKIETFLDTRTLGDFFGDTQNKSEGEIANGVFIDPVPHTIKTDDQLHRLQPTRHYFDILIRNEYEGEENLLPTFPGKLFENNEVELFTETLFEYYWMFKNRRFNLPYDEDIAQQLTKNFSVSAFCQHHKIEQKDLVAIEQASYGFDPHFDKFYKADDYRAEILRQIKLYLKHKSPKECPGLDKMFIEPSNQNAATPPGAIPDLPEIFKSKDYFADFSKEITKVKFAITLLWNGPQSEAELKQYKEPDHKATLQELMNLTSQEITLWKRGKRQRAIKHLERIELQLKASIADINSLFALETNQLFCKVPITNIIWILEKHKFSIVPEVKIPDPKHKYNYEDFQLCDTGIMFYPDLSMELEFRLNLIRDLVTELKELAGLTKEQEPPQQKKPNEVGEAKSEKQSTVVPKLTLSQIALKSAYESLGITKENANLIAKENGHTSGHKLCLKYNFFRYRENRKGEPESPTERKYLNKIKLIESVIELLQESHKQGAKDDLKILKAKFDEFKQK